jgi:hypothetical protein
MIFEVMFRRYGIPHGIGDFTDFGQQVKDKVYCTGSDIEWMVLQADKVAGREGLDEVEERHLLRAISDWELISIRPTSIARPYYSGRLRDLRPANWEQRLAEAKQRLGMMSAVAGRSESAVFDASHEELEGLEEDLEE